jgi:hypothetical protein
MEVKKMIKVGDLIQFTENHKWCGCFGFVSEVKYYFDGVDENAKVMIGVPVPEQGTAYIFSILTNNEFEIVGRAVMMPG